MGMGGLAAARVGGGEDVVGAIEGAVGDAGVGADQFGLVTQAVDGVFGVEGAWVGDLGVLVLAIVGVFFTLEGLLKDGGVCL